MSALPPTVNQARELAPLLGMRVGIRGRAENAKAGAIVVLADDSAVYLRGIEAWDSAMLGKTVIAGGLLQRDPPSAARTRDGILKQGVSGQPFYLEEAICRIDGEAQ